MSWLFPLYLLGAAAIIGPILMHLRRRPPQDRIEFSSLMFLEAQTPMPVSKRRIEHWLLLLLRCLALILLALMFARPLWQAEETAALGKNEAIYLLVDRSASMRRADLWTQAREETAKLVAAAKPEDRLAIATFDGALQALWTFAEDRDSASNRAAVVSQRLGQVTPGWGRTDLGKALVEASSAFGSEAGMTGLRKRIVVLTDFQEGSRLEALRGQVWPETVAVTVRRLEVVDQDNLALSLGATSEAYDSAEEDPSPHPQQAKMNVRVRVSNARDSKLSDYTLAWERGGGEPLKGYLPPGVSRVLVAPPVLEEKEASVLRLSGDRWDFDNRVFVAPPQPQPVHLVFLGDEKTRDEAASPLFYLSRALQPTARLTPELQVISPEATELPAAIDIVFISGAELKAPMLQSLSAFLKAGGLVVAVVDELMKSATLESLCQVKGITLSPSPSALQSDYLMLADVKTDHPLLRPFADERLRDFTKLRFWKHRFVDLQGEAVEKVKVLARFDNQAPAWLTVPSGKGSLILMTSGWHPADSQLALSTKFVPLLYGWLEAAGFRNETSPSLLVGDRLPLDADMTQVIAPDGQVLRREPGASLWAEQVGIYALQGRGGHQVAVNLPPEESRVAPYSEDKLRELGVKLEVIASDGVASPSAEEKERLAAHEQEGRQRAWLWLLAGVLLMLAGETWLAGRIREGRAQPAYS